MVLTHSPFSIPLPAQFLSSLTWTYTPAGSLDALSKVCSLYWIPEEIFLHQKLTMVTTALYHLWVSMAFPRFLPQLVLANPSVSFIHLLHIKLYISGKPNPSQFFPYTTLFLPADPLLMESLSTPGDPCSMPYLPRALLLILKGSAWVNLSLESSCGPNHATCLFPKHPTLHYTDLSISQDWHLPEGRH